jgi:hypothetical protein
MPDHQHLFEFPAPAGATSLGVCDCGEERLGYNTLDVDRPGTNWGGTPGRKGRAAKAATKQGRKRRV